MAHYLYLVRHGEQQDAEHGLPDGPLSPKGKRQANAIADRLSVVMTLSGSSRWRGWR